MSRFRRAPLLALLLASCDSVGPNDAASIILSETTLGLFTTERRTLAATVLDGSGAVIDLAVTWESSNPSVVTVDASGLLVAAGTGTAAITASVGSASAEASVRVTAPAALVFPLAGTLNTDFFYTNYVDLRADGGIQDFACGLKTYDGHRGIDIVLPSFAEMDRGVTVVAAAPGEVITVHDGDFDRQKSRNPGGFGNHVVIAHRDQFTTIYGQLRSGSVAVAVGESVDSGTVLGEVGSSGNSDHPHLHLELRQDSVTLEPFSGDCGPAVSQWAQPHEYQDAFQFITSGLTGIEPTLDALKDPPAHVDSYRTDDPRVVLWVQLYNVGPGMASSWELYDPAGSLQFAFQLPHRQFYSLSWWYGLFSIPAILQTPGTWRIDYKLNGMVRATRSFTIVQAAGPASRVRATPDAPGRAGGGGLRLDDRSPALNDPHQNHDDRYDEQQVNEPTERICADEPEEPQHEQNERDSPQHTILLRVLPERRSY